MRKLIALVLVCAISVPVSADDELHVVRSNPVSLGDGDYTLEVEVSNDEPTLVLRHVPLEGETILRPIDCSLNAELLPEESSVDWKNTHVRQIVMGRYTRSGILFAIRSEVEEDAAIWAGIIYPASSDSDPLKVATFDYLTECGPSYKILSASGIGQMAAFSILAIDLAADPFGPTPGIIITSYCPGPVSDARIGRFEATYPPSLWDE